MIVNLSIMEPESEEILLELAVELPEEDLDTFVNEFEDYFCGGSVTYAQPNIIPDSVELL